MGATSQQYQDDCRANTVPMVHIPAKTRNSFTLPQFNFIGWLAYQLPLSLQEEHPYCHHQGQNYIAPLYVVLILTDVYLRKN